jgi:hypothetical protein
MPPLPTATATTTPSPTLSAAHPTRMALPPHPPTAVASRAKTHAAYAVVWTMANPWYNANLARTGCTWVAWGWVQAISRLSMCASSVQGKRLLQEVGGSEDQYPSTARLRTSRCSVGDSTMLLVSLKHDTFIWRRTRSSYLCVPLCGRPVMSVVALLHFSMGQHPRIALTIYLIVYTIALPN